MFLFSLIPGFVGNLRSSKTGEEVTEMSLPILQQQQQQQSPASASPGASSGCDSIIPTILKINAARFELAKLEMSVASAAQMALLGNQMHADDLSKTRFSSTLRRKALHKPTRNLNRNRQGKAAKVQEKCSQIPARTSKRAAAATKLDVDSTVALAKRRKNSGPSKDNKVIFESSVLKVVVLPPAESSSNTSDISKKSESIKESVVDKALASTPKPKSASTDEICPEPIDSTLSLENLAQDLEEETKFVQRFIVFPLANQQTFSKSAEPLPKGLILNGDDSEMKLLLARTLTAELSRAVGQTFNFFRGPDGRPFKHFKISKEGGEYFTKLAGAALAKTPSVLFLDDHMLRSADIATVLDKLMSDVEAGKVLVIAAPCAGYMTGGWNKVVGADLSFRPPTETRRRQIFETFLAERKQQMLSPNSLDHFVKETQGFTCTKLKNLLADVYQSAIQRRISSTMEKNVFGHYTILPEDVQVLHDDWKACGMTTTAPLTEKSQGKIDKLTGKSPTKKIDKLLEVAALVQKQEDLHRQIFGRECPPGFKFDLSSLSSCTVPPVSQKQNSAKDADLGQVAVDESLSFSSVGGLDEQIENIRELILFPLLNKEAFKEWGIEPAKGLIFHGPPGTGKTLLAKTLAAELTRASGSKNEEFSFFCRKGTDCHRKYVGETEAILRALFAAAVAKKPSIIFFDEIDGLCPERSSGKSSKFENGVVTTIVGLLDNVNRGEVLVIAATNRLSSLDPALVRPGRFDRSIAFNPPKSQGRAAILKMHSSLWKPGRYAEEMFGEIAERTEGYTGADLEQLCRQTLLCAIRRQFPAGEMPSAAAIEVLQITRPDWYSALKSVRGSESNVFDHAVTSGKSFPAGIAKLISEIVAEIAKKIEPFLSTSELEEMNGTGIKSLLLWDAGVGRARSIDSFIIPTLIQDPALKGTTTFTLTADKFAVNHHGNGSNLQKFMKQVLTCSSKTAILYIPRLDELELKLVESNLQHLFLDQMDAIRGKDVVVLATASGPLSSLSAGGTRRIFGKGDPESRSYQMRKFEAGECREFFETIVGAKGESQAETRIKLWLAKVENLTSGASLVDILDLGEEIRKVVAAGNKADEKCLSEKLDAILDKFRNHGDNQLYNLYS